jgi:hypothetical protein
MRGSTRTKPQTFTRFSTLCDRLTAGQRAFARVVYDGIDPCDLAGEEGEKAREIFGAVDRVPDVARRVVVQNKGREVGGTRLAAERAAHLGLTLGITRTDADETVFAFFGGPKARHARVGLRFARAALVRRGVTILEDSKDGFTIRRSHDGRRVRFEIFAASRGGDNTRGVPVVCAVLTEASFYFDEQSGVANGEAIFGAIIPRLLPGGQIIIESTPWAESGLHHREFSRNHGSPVTAIAAHCPTLVMRDDAETRAMVEQEYERDSENAHRELGANFMPVGSGHYFDHFAIGRCSAAELPIEAEPPHDNWTVVGGYDPAYVRDAAEGVVVRTNGLQFEVVATLSRVPQKDKPLVPSEVDSEFAMLVKRHGGHVISTDIHYREAVREHVGSTGICLYDSPGGNAGKCEVFGIARDLINGDHVRWSAGHARLARQMREIVAKALPGGLVSISSPRRRGDHGDAAHALCLGLRLAKEWHRRGDDSGLIVIDSSERSYPDEARWRGRYRLGEDEAVDVHALIKQRIRARLGIAYDP